MPRCSPFPVLALDGANSPLGIHRGFRTGVQVPCRCSVALVGCGYSRPGRLSLLLGSFDLTRSLQKGYRVGWLDALSLCQASLGTPPKHLSGHRPEQRPPGRRGQAPRPLGRQPQGRRGPYPGAPAARSYSGLPALRPARCATWAMTRCHRSKMVRCCETRRCPLAGRCIQRDAYMGSVPKWFDEGQRRRRLERPQGIPWRQAG